MKKLKAFLTTQSIPFCLKIRKLYLLTIFRLLPFLVNGFLYKFVLNENKKSYLKAHQLRKGQKKKE